MRSGFGCVLGLVAILFFIISPPPASLNGQEIQGPPVLPQSIYPEFFGLPDFGSDKWVTFYDVGNWYYPWEYNNLSFVTRNGPSVRSAILMPKGSQSYLHIYAPAHFRDGRPVEHILSFWYNYISQNATPTGDSFVLEVNGVATRNLESSSRWKKVTMKIPASDSAIKLAWVMYAGSVPSYVQHYGGLDAVEWRIVEPIVNYSDPDFTISPGSNGTVTIRWDERKYAGYVLVSSETISGPWQRYNQGVMSFYNGVVTVSSIPASGKYRFFRLMSP